MNPGLNTLNTCSDVLVECECECLWGCWSAQRASWKWSASKSSLANVLWPFSIL